MACKSRLCSPPLCVYVQARGKCHWKFILEQKKPNQHISSPMLSEALKKQRPFCRARYIRSLLEFTFSRITAFRLFSTITSLLGLIRIKLLIVPCQKSKEEFFYLCSLEPLLKGRLLQACLFYTCLLVWKNCWTKETELRLTTSVVLQVLRHKDVIYSESPWWFI